MTNPFALLCGDPVPTPTTWPDGARREHKLLDANAPVHWDEGEKPPPPEPVKRTPVRDPRPPKGTIRKFEPVRYRPLEPGQKRRRRETQPIDSGPVPAAPSEVHPALMAPAPPPPRVAPKPPGPMTYAQAMAVRQRVRDNQPVDEAGAAARQQDRPGRAASDARWTLHRLTRATTACGAASGATSRRAARSNFRPRLRPMRARRWPPTRATRASTRTPDRPRQTWSLVSGARRAWRLLIFELH